MCWASAWSSKEAVGASRSRAFVIRVSVGDANAEALPPVGVISFSGGESFAFGFTVGNTHGEGAARRRQTVIHPLQSGAEPTLGRAPKLQSAEPRRLAGELNRFGPRHQRQVGHAVKY